MEARRLKTGPCALVAVTINDLTAASSPTAKPVSMKRTKAFLLFAGFIQASLIGLCGQIVGSEALTNGLVAYYPFNGNANDESGSGNDGVIYGATLTTDRFGRSDAAFRFSGTNSFIQIPASPILDGLSALSISAWLKLDPRQPVPSENWCIAEKYDRSAYLLWSLQTTHSTNALFEDGFAIAYDDFTAAETSLASGRYHHVVATDQNGVVSIFLDGLLIHKGTGGAGIRPGNHAAITIGARAAYFPLIALGLHGDIDDVRIYDRALSASEVVQLYALESLRPLPRLTLLVRTVRLSMFVEAGRLYQIQTSSDLSSWATNGGPFLASSARMFEDFDVLDGERYFRIVEVP